MCNKPKLYLIQGEEEVGELVHQELHLIQLGDETKESKSKNLEAPKIYIHAIVGTSTTNTMRLMGNVKEVLVEILVDSNNIHNVLNLLIAQRAKFSIEEVSKLVVKIANEDKIHNVGYCNQVQFKAQGTNFNSTFHLLELGRCDMV